MTPTDVKHRPAPTSVTLKPKQVETEYGIPAGTLANMRWRAEGPRYVKLGRTVLYFRADIESWIESKAVETAAAGR